MHERSEYTVTDGENWASNIDKVYRISDDTFSLGDIKTYGTMTSEKQEKARWQLSIYAYFFELQNKGASVDKLFIIHLRNKEKTDGTFDHRAEILPVERISSQTCKELLDADLQGKQFVNPYSIPDKYKEKESYIRQLIRQTICEPLLNSRQVQGKGKLHQAANPDQERDGSRTFKAQVGNSSGYGSNRSKDMGDRNNAADKENAECKGFFQRR